MRTTQEEIDQAAWRSSTLKGPHEYFMAVDNPGLFEKLSKDIDESSVTAVFKGRRYRYLILPPHKYWRFKTLINRARIEDP